MVFSNNNTFTIFVLFVIGGLVSLTFDPAIIIIYFIMLAFYLHYAKYFKYPVLVFIILILFLYPTTATNMKFFNERFFLLPIIIIIILILYINPIRNIFKQEKALKRIVSVFFIYGTTMYIIALFGYLLNNTLGINIFDHAPLSTSHILHYFRGIPLVFIVLAPILTIINEKHFKMIFKLYMILLFINVFFGLLQYFYGIQIVDEGYSMGFRLGAYGSERRLFSFSNPDPIAFGFTLSYPLLILLVYLLNINYKSSYLALSLLTIITILLTFSRATYISFTAGMLISLFLVSKKPKVLFKYSTIVLSITLLIIYSGVPEKFSTVPRLASTTSSILDVESRTNPMFGRLHKYRVAWEILQENPILGASPGGMPELSHTTLVGSIGMESVHNLYLQAAVDYGFPMMLIVIIILIYSFSLGLKILKNYKHEIMMRNNRYLHIFLLASTAYVLSCIIYGIAESLTYNVIFLNLGFIIAAKRILQRKNILL